MKKTYILILLILSSFLSLTACVKDQNTDATGNSAVDAQASANNPTTNTQNTMNDTNYQEMMREQSARAAQIESEHPHAGRR
jgi:protein involved in sex pheromone biosynthesis